MRVGSSHTLQEFFLPFHYLYPYLFPSLLSEITSKNFPFLYLMILLLWDTQRFQLQFSSVAQSCLTLSDPMDCRTPGFPVHHQFLELAHTHVHRVSDGIQLSPALFIPFSSCHQSFQASGSFPMSQFFASGDQSIGVSASASVLPMNIQNWFPLGLIGLISLQSKGLSRVFSHTIVQKHQFFSV